MNNVIKKLLLQLWPWVVLAVGMSLARMLIADDARYMWMNWNLFLGLLPIIFAWLFTVARNKILRGLWFVIWLLFLPNAIYKVTDFIHIQTSTNLDLLWYDGMMLFAYALAGVMVSAYTTIAIVRVISDKRPQRLVWYGLISILSAFGIYLGRYIRWNTWDIVTRPLDLFANIFEVLGTQINQPVFYLTMIFFTLLSFIGIVSFGRNT